MRNNRLRFDLEKLNDPKIASEFEAKIGGRFAALNFLHDDINTLTQNFNQTIQETALEVLGKERRKIQPWTTNEVMDLCDKRRELKPHKRTGQKAAEEYKVINREIRTKMREAKELWVSEQCDKVEESAKLTLSKFKLD